LVIQPAATAPRCATIQNIFGSMERPCRKLSIGLFCFDFEAGCDRFHSLEPTFLKCRFPVRPYPSLQLWAGDFEKRAKARGAGGTTARREQTRAAGLDMDMDMDGADGVAASGLAAGTVGDGAVEDGQSSAVPGDSRPNKRQRREEEGGAGEELRRRRTQETACCLVAASHVHFFFLGAWRCTGWPNITAEEMLTSEMRP
jgi:hypothetical protein